MRQSEGLFSVWLKRILSIEFSFSKVLTDIDHAIPSEASQLESREEEIQFRSHG